MARLATTIALTLATAGACTTATPPGPPPSTTLAPTTQPGTTTTAPTTTTPTVVRRAARVRVAPNPDQTPVAEGNEGAAAQTARVSWYGNESGSRTANGEAFTGDDLTFAHLSMPFGTMVRFCHAGACVVARCNDRGPAAWTGKTFDLSRAAFASIAPLGRGVVDVTWEAA
jgi:rare lipoprotein A